MTSTRTPTAAATTTPATKPTASGADGPQQRQTAPAKAKPQPKPYGPSASVLARALVAGEVRVYRQRKVGTLRLVPFYAKGSEVRVKAEAMTKALAALGVAKAASDAGVSIVTARRLVANLALTESIERKELDALWDGQAPTVVLPPKADA